MVNIGEATQHLIALGLHRTLATDTAEPKDILVVLAAEPGIVADMISTLLPHTVVGTTDTGTVVAILTGEAWEAMLRALPHIRVACDCLDDYIPVIMFAGTLLTMTAVRVARGSHDRRWSS
jgi:hypothetical protein